jgi:hypothetical protein
LNYIGMVRLYRNKNIFWRWIEIKFVFFCRGLQTQKKVVHILAYKEFVLLLQCMLMRGLWINIPVFWVSFLWAHSLVEKFCGELKKQCEQPFPPIRLAKTSSRARFLLLLTSHILRREKKARSHECKWENGYGIW